MQSITRLRQMRDLDDLRREAQRLAPLLEKYGRCPHDVRVTVAGARRWYCIVPNCNAEGRAADLARELAHAVELDAISTFIDHKIAALAAEGRPHAAPAA